MTIRLALIAAALAAPAFAEDTKEESCGYQAQVVAAIQQARLDRVKERDVAETLTAADPAWPENYSAAIPLMAPWVYQQKMRVIRNEDLSVVWNELCLTQ